MKKIFGLGFYTFCIVALFVILYFSQGQSYEGFADKPAATKAPVKPDCAKIESACGEKCGEDKSCKDKCKQLSAICKVL